MTTHVTLPTASAVRRIATFYDGSFFQKFNNWCKDKLGGFINFQGLHSYISFWISNEVERHSPEDLFRVVEAHYFQGRFPIDAAMRQGSKNGKPFVKSGSPELPPEAYYIAKDRQIDEVLMYANVTTHYYPMRYDKERERGEEKGIDVWLSLEAYDLAVHKRFDYFVLFSGDEDFVPLVRKINSLGITTIIPQIDISTAHDPIGLRTSYKLIQEASYHLLLAKKLQNSEALSPKEREKLKEVIYIKSA